MIILFDDVKKSKSKYTDYIKGLIGFLEKEEPKLIKKVFNFLNNRKNAVDLSVIKECVLERKRLKDDVFKKLENECKDFTEEQLKKEWLNSMTAGAVSAGESTGRFYFLKKSKSYEEYFGEKWLNEHAAEFVTNMSKGQREALNTLIVNAYKSNATPDALARQIESAIGLTKPQAIANQNYFFNRYKNLIKHKPTAGEKDIAKILRDTQDYAKRQMEHRAMTIARTELVRGYHAGEYYGMKYAQGKGLIGKAIKRISTAGDGRVCEGCQNLDGKDAEIDGYFETNWGDILFPPFHPCCRCEVLYIEQERPKKRETENGTDIQPERGNINTEFYPPYKKPKGGFADEPAFIHIKDKKTVPKNVLERINEELLLIPEEHRRIIKETIKETRVITSGNSRYDRKRGILYISNKFEKGELIHELGHAIETKLDLYNNKEFLMVLENGIDIKIAMPFDDDTFEQPIQRIRNPKFISEYQGRVYDGDVYGNEQIDYVKGGLNIKCLGEYFSEGYKGYFIEPQNLKSKDKMLYDFVEGLNLNEP